MVVLFAQIKIYKVANTFVRYRFDFQELKMSALSNCVNYLDVNILMRSMSSNKVE
mgnify:CR=1 FL=1